MMENTHDRRSADIAAHKNLVESIITDEGRRDFVRSPWGISAETPATSCNSVNRKNHSQYRIPEKQTKEYRYFRYLFEICGLIDIYGEIIY